MATHPTRCPHCGITIPAILIPASRNLFNCPRCRSELEVAPSDPLPILLASLALAIAICFVLDLSGFSLVTGIAAATAFLYLLGGFARMLIATPKLRARTEYRESS